MKRLFTHSDLDGAGCAVLFKIMYPDGEVTYCGSGNASDKMREMLRQGDIPDTLVITDVSIDAAMAEEIEVLIAKGVQVIMHDHHETSLDLKGRKWANIDIRFCATALYFNSLRSANPRIKDYTEFVRLVNIFDNYQVGQKEFPRAHQLNKICEYHREVASLTSFVERFLADTTCDPAPSSGGVRAPRSTASVESATAHATIAVKASWMIVNA
jgi:oligoribonuclease NrnB/cAMP/cGMP phosphodiesterase (DHH superfamily)